MKTKDYTALSQRRYDVYFGMRGFLAVLLSLSIFIGQSSAAMNSHEAGSSSIWIEICADGGSEFVEIDESGQQKAPECSHCVFCLVPSGDTQGVAFIANSGVELPEFISLSYLSDQASLPDSPEQYWSACRGPPIASIEKTMTTLASLYGNKPTEIALNTWSLPCV